MRVRVVINPMASGASGGVGDIAKPIGQMSRCFRCTATLVMANVGGFCFCQCCLAMWQSWMRGEGPRPVEAA